MISWHNPTAEDRDLGLNDYLRLGVFEALKAIQAIVPEPRSMPLAIASAGRFCPSPPPIWRDEKNSLSIP